MPLNIGARLGPYEILSPLGAGGMGEVYKARDTRLDRTVAVKVLPSETSNDPDLRARFEREAHAIAALDHPHICSLHDVGEQDGVHYLVMQHLEGETLASRLARTNGPLPLDQVLRIAIEIAGALDKAHRAGITHRDLKPANIMLTKSGTMLLDFGLAKLRGPEVPTSMTGATSLPTKAPETAQGTILGTLHYMAPEQIEGRPSDARSDIWALGAVIYEAATGKRPFDGKSPASVIGAILRDVPPLMATTQPLTPPALDHIVATCLMKDPDDRWQSAADIVHELKWAPAATLSHSAPRRSYAAVAWSIASLATLGAAVALMVALQRPAVDARLMRFEIASPPTASPQSMALSPDGRALAFVANHDGGSRLWVRALDQSTSRPLSGTDGANFPFWSPDGRSLGFFADGKMKRVDLPNGVPQVLADAVAGRGGTWNTDGVIVFAPATVGPLMRISASAANGPAIAVTQLQTGRGSHRMPQFLPDGRHFLFFMALVPLEERGTYMGSLDSPEVTRVLASGNGAVYAPDALLFVRESSLVAVRFSAATGAVSGEPITIAEDVGVVVGAFRGAFAVSPGGIVVHKAIRSGLRQLVWVDRNGKQLGTIGPPDENALMSPALSPDEQRVMIGRTVQSNSDIWVTDVARGVVSRLTSEASNEGGPVWFPNGRSVVFYSDRNGIFDLFQAPAGGTGDSVRVTDFAESTVPQTLSPDGQLLVYAAQSASTGSDLWMMRMSGDRQASPIVKTPADDQVAQLSTDGKWLVYESNVSGRTEVYVQSFPTAGDRVQVSKGGGVQPRWRPDGRELFYVAPNGDLMAVPIATAANESAPKPGVPVPLFRTRLVPTTAAPTFLKPQYAVARDGRFLMNVTLEPPPRVPIEVVVNWTTLLDQ